VGRPCRPGDLGAPGKDAVTRIELATGRAVATVTVGRAPLDLGVTPGAVWVTNSGGGGDSVARIDPQANRAVETVAVGGHPIDVAAAGGAVWVSVADPGTVLRIAGR
jgi:DNA-binding beta-propeller fold protein YncE